MTEVATLKQVLSEAEKKAGTERTEREKHEARVGEVQQELQALVKKHETLELDLKTRESELARPLRAQSVPRLKPKRPSRKLRR